MASLDMDEGQDRERVLALPQLQSLMKKDPEAYAPEFDQQWSHFESMMDLFKLKPQKPHQSFSEQVMFLAHVAPSFPAKSSMLPGQLIGALDEHCEVMHPSMRSTLVQALILLRNRDQFPCLRTLPLYFKLFRLQDKSLRNMMFTHIVRDLVQMTQKNRSQKTMKELRDFFFKGLQEIDAEVSRRACAVFISMYRQNIWRDAIVVNLMSAGLTHPDVKIAAALAHLFLGNKTKGLEGILADSDDESEKDDAAEVVHGIVGAKKTGNRMKRLARAKKAASRATQRKKKGANVQGVSFAAIDMLNDPQTLADRLLQRVNKAGEPFLFRLLILHVVARLTGRHSLLLLNLYPFFLRYLNPKQNEVTQILACLVEACHAQVPPDELRPVVLHVRREFVTEGQASEVIEVGLNTIREICSRAVEVLNEEELADLVSFRKYKNKGVSMAARSLINTYREINPQLLHRSLRGREATMALSRGDLVAPQYGAAAVNDNIEGLDVISKKWTRQEVPNDGDAETGNTPQAENSSQQILTEQVLSSEDFKKLRKLRLQRSIEMQMGGKRKRQDAFEDSSSSEDEDDGSSDGDDEEGLQGRLPSSVAASDLQGKPARKRTKKDRLESARSGRTDFKEKIKEKQKSRKGGKTNQEQKRNKPMLMSMQSKRVQTRKARTAGEKLKSLKTHVKTLKQNAKRQKRRR